MWIPPEACTGGRMECAHSSAEPQEGASASTSVRAALLIAGLLAVTVYLTKAMYGRKGSSDSQFQGLGLSWRGRHQEHEGPGHTVTAIRKQGAVNTWAHVLLGRLGPQTME